MDAIVDQLTIISKELVEIDAKYGENKKFIKFEIDVDKQGKDQFAAAAIFGTIFVRDGSTSCETPEVHHLVIKTEPPSPHLREMFQSHFQFQNEILFYTKLLPFLTSFQTREEHSFAKFCKGGLKDPVLSSYVIMENATSEGFRLSNNRQLLNVDHFLLALNRLGRFHGLSYIAKHRNLTEFLEFTSQIKETSWTDERISKGDDMDPLISCSVTRSIEKFDNIANEDQEKSVNTLFRDQLVRLKRLLIGSPMKFMKEITSPKEPMAVLCHGDFCRNNMLFKYDDHSSNLSNKDDSSSPTDVMFFDMATIRYSSPVIDLSFCIYLNSNADIRRQHWNRILESYHDGLKSCVEDYAEKHKVNVIVGKEKYASSTTEDIFMPSLEDVHSEFFDHAIYGFVHCSFFLPTMLDESIMQEIAKGFDFFSLSLEEKLKVQMAIAGEEGTRALNNIVEHLFQMKFV